MCINRIFRFSSYGVKMIRLLGASAW